MSYGVSNETRSYNVLGQLVNLAANGENLTYNYPTGTNNGKISSMSNAVSGETVAYTYDSLNRMITANGSGWGEAYTFDPFGNLTTKHVTAGSGPSLLVSVNANNQVTSVYGQGYDANGNTKDGNMTAYDAENHLIGGGWNNGAPAVDYGYDAQGKRFFMWPAGTLDSWGNDTNYSVVMYSPSGQKLGTYLISVCNQGANNTTSLTICSALQTSDKYFGGRRLAVMDQLGSAGTYYPWGEAKGSTNPQDAWSYATYWRDSVTGLDYANQRYYSNQYGRFMTPDPYTNSGRLNDPGSWNRYAYTRGDPANRVDPGGTDDGDPGDSSGGTSGSPCGTAWESDASLVGNPCGIEQVPGPYGGMVYINVAAIAAAAVAQAQAAAATAQQNCENALALQIGTYLGSKSSPLAPLAAQFVSLGQQYDVDPRFIVALSRAESTWGKNLTAKQGPYNAWSVSTHYVTGYSSFLAALTDVTKLIGTDRRYIQGGNIQAESIYQIYNATFNLQYYQDTVVADMNNLGGNVNDVRFPCPP